MVNFTEVFQLCFGDKFVVIVDRGVWIVLQFFSQVIEEGTPLRSWPQTLKEKDNAIKPGK